MRAACGGARYKACKSGACLCHHRITLDRNPGRFQPVKALSCGARIRVCQRAHDARRLGGDQRIGASRPAAALMRARLEAYIYGCTRRCVPSLCESHGLGMRAAAGLGPAAPDDYAILDDDAADRGVVARPPLAAFGKRDCGG